MLLEYTNRPLVILVLLCSLHLSLVNGHLNKCDYFFKKEELVNVLCSGRNYTTFPLVSGLPENTSIISFRDNKIQHLPNQPEHLLRDKVWSIDLSGNVIEQLLEDKVLKAFPNMSHLDLPNHRIRSLSDNSFQYLIKLRVLHLSYNKLAWVRQGWFSHLFELSWLDLGYNKINVIDVSESTWPSQLRYLNLSYNQLRTIPSLPNNASVRLNSNPIFCGCDFSVNKNISETLIIVDCHRLDYIKKPTEIEKRVDKYDKYRSSINTCKPATILKFSSLIAEGQIVLTCVITSFGYPPAALFIYFEKKVIKISKDHVILEVTEPGMYTCRVTNYISSQERDIYIPLSTSATLEGHESEVSYYTTYLSNHNET